MAITIATLRAAGLTAEQIVRVLEIEQDERLAKRAETFQKASRKYRARQHLVVDGVDGVDALSPSLPDKEKSPPTPPSKEINPLSPSREGRASAQRRGSRLSEDWKPINGDAQFARQLLPKDWRIEAEKFRDYWQARAGPQGVKLDWSATWRNWCRRAAESKGYPTGSQTLFDCREKPIPP